MRSFTISKLFLLTIIATFTTSAAAAAAAATIHADASTGVVLSAREEAGRELSIHDVLLDFSGPRNLLTEIQFRVELVEKNGAQESSQSFLCEAKAFIFENDPIYNRNTGIVSPSLFSKNEKVSFVLFITLAEVGKGVLLHHRSAEDISLLVLCLEGGKSSSRKLLESQLYNHRGCWLIFFLNSAKVSFVG